MVEFVDVNVFYLEMVADPKRPAPIPREGLAVLHPTAGFAGLNCRKPDEIELVQFGLMPDFIFIGQGLGKWFLQWTIDKAWSYRPRRFWPHTCSLDHAAALPTYTKAGFVQYNEERIRREL